MRISRFSRILLVALSLGFTSAAQAHVEVQAPNGGETFIVGDQVNISWTILIAHNLQNWDLWYSTTGANGPWIPMATDLTAGSGLVGSIHSYDWTVPSAAISSDLYIRVRMDNSATDYYDKNDTAITVLASPWTDLGGGTSGINGAVNLSGDGSLVGGTPVSLSLTNGPPSEFALLWISFASTPTNYFGGTLYPIPANAQLLLVTSPSGSVGGGTTFPAGLPPGTDLYFQFLCQDLTTIHGITLSNGLKGTTP
jgi:hypothetical protein